MRTSVAAAPRACEVNGGGDAYVGEGVTAGHDDVPSRRPRSARRCRRCPEVVSRAGLSSEAGAVAEVRSHLVRRKQRAGEVSDAVGRRRSTTCSSWAWLPPGPWVSAGWVRAKPCAFPPAIITASSLATSRAGGLSPILLSGVARRRAGLRIQAAVALHLHVKPQLGRTGSGAARDGPPVVWCVCHALRPV